MMTELQDETTRRPLPSRFAADVAIIITIIALWWLWLCPGVLRSQPVAFDTFRDTAAVENVLAGRWFRDPVSAGQTYWYAPLGPIIFAGITCLTGRSPIAVYSSSILWLNVLLPIGWYVLARSVWDRRTAIAAVPLILFGSLWWTTHAALPMTSIQGVILATAVLIAWSASLGRGRRCTAAVGLLLGFCTWYHTLSALIAAAAIGLHAVATARTWSRSQDPQGAGRGGEAMIRLAVVAGVCAIIVAPLAWHLLTLSRRNLLPLEYLAAEMRDPAYALQSGTLLVLPLALIGVICALTNLSRGGGLVLSYALVAFTGQVLGYARLFTGLRVPVLIPHEFQWHFQAAVGMLAARGAWRTADWLAGRIKVESGAGTKWRLAILVGLVAAAVGPRLPRAVSEETPYWKAISAERAGDVAEAVAWIKRHTAIDDVFLGDEPTDFFLVAGLTGRKLQCPPAGHTSTAVSAEELALDRARLFETTSREEFRRLLSRHNVRYVMLQHGQEGLWQRWREWNVLEPQFSSSSRFVSFFRVTAETGPASPAQQ